ncbi:MAG: haloacid dehalogenase-like hydrolase [Methanosarcinales archaeon]|jgi:2-hydroxy-3-keto-5-methylthiopentenyl-1-phosphate phosphatase|nr:haloacid dehalogenase-like hydrolase [Methanosarcinales archaeon]
MNDNEFQRESKEDRPVLAICYDFDKTLSPDNMQAQGYIQSVGYGVEDFWKESNALAENNGMDQNLAYMYKMVHEAEGRIITNKKTLEEYGAKVNLLPGVEDWFERIRKYGLDRNVIVEHYIISSGLKEMIEGTSVARKGAFKRIYASSFYYDPKSGVAKWPAQVVNYTSKTQFLFRIEKGVLDVNDSGVNESFAVEELRVPFRNIIYIGDSDTDIPCMKLVHSYGGHSIGVYDSKTQDKAKVYKMMRDNRIKFFASADYSEGMKLDMLVKSIIDRTAANERLESIHYCCKKEYIEADRNNSEESRKKTDLIIELGSSGSFVSTHLVVKKLQTLDDWTADEKEQLFDIAVENSQVFYVLGDSDLRFFYKKLLQNISELTPNAKKIKEAIEEGT